jgi:hypothetical protein
MTSDIHCPTYHGGSSLLLPNSAQNSVSCAKSDIAGAAKTLLSLTRNDVATDPHGTFRRGIEALSTLYRYGELTSLVPMLPLLLAIKGKPMTLEKYFVMEPVYSLVVPRKTVYKTARQVSKSTGLAASRLLQSAFRPHFSSLYVTPLYSQATRFSTLVLRPMLKGSPIRKILLEGSNVVNSVLQIALSNGATQHFGFAFNDCERLRGIAADSVDLDESICYGTPIETSKGMVPIGELKVGDHVYGYDENGIRHDDRVTKCMYHNVRDCYRITCADGSTVDITSKSWIATTAGWKRVETIVREAHAAVADGCSDTDAVRDYARGRQSGCCILPSRKSDIPEPARLVPACVQLSQAPDVVRVRSHAAAEETERRVRRMAQHLADIKLSGALAYRVLVSGRTGQEAGDAGLAGQAGLGRDSVVVPGRRKPDVAQHDGGVSHGGVLGGGVPADRELAVGDDGHCVPRSPAEAPSRNRTVLDNPVDGGFDAAFGESHSPVRPQEHGVQDRAAGANGSEMSALREPGTRSPLHEEDADVRKSGVRRCGADCDQAEVCGQAGKGGGAQAAAAGGVCRRRRCGTGGGCQSCGSAAESKPGTVQGGKSAVHCEGAGSAGDAPMDVPALRNDKGAGGNGHADEVLPDLQASSKNGASGRIHGSPPDKDAVYASPVVRIEWVGAHPVYDIETEKYHTYYAGGIAVHNCQDINPEFLPVIEATMDGSEWAARRYFGTPKTSDNLLQLLFDDSSGAEWVTTCTACNRDNIAALAHHLMDMMQPQGVSCYHCGKLIDPALGHFEHERPDRRHLFAGYHVPQAIMPFHYANKEKWYELYQAKLRMNRVNFLNEKCGESCDVMSTLLSREDLKAASTLKHENRNTDGNTEELRKHAGRYHAVTMGTDWGGYGMSGISYTAHVILGHLPDGKIDVLRMFRVVQTEGNTYEAKQTIHLASIARAQRLGHDFNGAGAARESLLIQAGFPIGALMPFAYTGNTTQSIARYHPANQAVARGYYGLDKARAVAYVCALIKAGYIRFPTFASWSEREIGLQSLADDFLAIAEDHVELDRTSTVTVIRKKPGRSDDVFHALVYAVFAYCEASQAYPDIALLSGVQLTPEQQDMLSPAFADYDDFSESL